MYKFKAYTDGACSGNPGVGGWGAVLLAEKNNKIIKRKEISGGLVDTTNNQMELIAAIETLKALKKYTEICIITDSNYVKKGITEWLPSWKKNNWKTSSKKEVKNRKLWEELEELVNRNKVDWLWVKGHAGNIENERADFLAREEINKIK
ncbi:MAG: ribonuclease HI [Pseudomonadota bacterium]|jgi:ribonuclease HI|nr:ribonuclease HI [Rhodobacterales bacterium]MEE2621233.1 ribonuclease HI [Pseudomonadota bacterium]|tara:strand:- start:221 stop:670 length:450 start_codon:yes stop_codon:yes gene_type:complete